ncbi:MAG: hypothetical protein SGARI_000224 [Bacillariaceae sp.]
MTKKQCNYDPREGYNTARAQKEYLDNQNKKECPYQSSRVVDRDSFNEYSLIASNKPNDPLYFWQLYSLLGEQPIVGLVRDFYTRVYDDNDPSNGWFKQAFTQLASKEHHIATQAAYWIDVMGGGRYYPGGDRRLSFHHGMNAHEVMNERGAKLWMKYMRGALESARFEDVRVKPCILDFLNDRMKKYADEFGWKHDEKDMILYQDSDE